MTGTGTNPAAGRRSRSWSTTGGRVAHQDGDIRLDTHVTTRLSVGVPPPGSQFSHILQLCQTTLAVAQIAASLSVPVGVAAALVAELRDHGWVETRAPLDMTGDGVVTSALLRRLREGLRNAI